MRANRSVLEMAYFLKRNKDMRPCKQASEKAMMT